MVKAKTGKEHRDRIILTKGTVLTCEAGHEVCEVALDLRADVLINGDMYCNFREGQHVVVNGDLVNQFCSCGARWTRLEDRCRPTANYIGLLLHTARGWIDEDGNVVTFDDKGVFMNKTEMVRIFVSNCPGFEDGGVTEVPVGDQCGICALRNSEGTCMPFSTKIVEGKKCEACREVCDAGVSYGVS